MNNEREEKESIDEGREENDREDNQPNATTLWLAACRYLISVFELNTMKRSCLLLVLERKKNQHNKTRRERKNRREQGTPPPKKRRLGRCGWLAGGLALWVSSHFLFVCLLPSFFLIIASSHHLCLCRVSGSGLIILINEGLKCTCVLLCLPTKLLTACSLWLFIHLFIYYSLLRLASYFSYFGLVLIRLLGALTDSLAG
jgi:hypothetical protein